MVVIPGQFIALLTFPGVIVHEAAHMFFCRMRGIAIFDVCFFRMENPCGYVVHEDIKDFTSAFLVSVGPLIINTLLCMVICFPAFMPVRIFDSEDPLNYLMIYLGVSIGMHAFPSTQDAAVLWVQARKALGSFNPLALISLPLVGLIYLANILSIFWFDALYGIAVGLLLPELIFNQLL